MCKNSHFAAVLAYIRQNPVNFAVVSRAEDWP